jgi:hypothetical protein
LSTSIAWFKKYYEKDQCAPILIHPERELNSDAFVAEPFWVITMDTLKLLKDAVAKFYSSLTEVPFDTITAAIIAKKLQSNSLEIGDMQKNYLIRIDK